MAELIAFLIEHFQDFDACPPTPDLGHFLEEVGFDEVEVGNALMLLHVLAEQPPLLHETSHTQVLRVYCAEELENLPQEVIGLLHFLEQAGALNTVQREYVIHALLHLPADEITVDMAKLLALLVLWAQKAELPVLIGDELMMALQRETMMH